LDLRVNYPLFWPILSKNLIMLADFSKTPQYKLSRKSIRWESRCFMRTSASDRHEKLVGAFRSFCLKIVGDVLYMFSFIYLTTLSVLQSYTASNGWVLSWIMNPKGCRMKYWGKNENLRISGLWAEIWIRDLLNMKQECYSFERDFYTLAETLNINKATFWLLHSQHSYSYRYTIVHVYYMFRPKRPSGTRALTIPHFFPPAMPSYAGRCLHIGSVLDECIVLVMPLYYINT
jgi:hypothetical protein